MRRHLNVHPWIMYVLGVSDSQIDESPKEGLARMMTLSNTHANGSQWFYALNRAVTVQLDRIIDEEFVKVT